MHVPRLRSVFSCVSRTRAGRVRQQSSTHGDASTATRELLLLNTAARICVHRAVTGFCFYPKTNTNGLGTKRFFRKYHASIDGTIYITGRATDTHSGARDGGPARRATGGWAAKRFGRRSALTDDGCWSSSSVRRPRTRAHTRPTA